MNDTSNVPGGQGVSSQDLLWRPLRDLAWKTQLEQLSSSLNDYRLTLLALASVKAVTGPGLDAVQIAEICSPWHVDALVMTQKTRVDSFEQVGAFQQYGNAQRYAGRGGPMKVYSAIRSLISKVQQIYSVTPAVPSGFPTFVDPTRALSWGPKIMGALLPILGRKAQARENAR